MTLKCWNFKLIVKESIPVVKSPTWLQKRKQETHSDICKVYTAVYSKYPWITFSVNLVYLCTCALSSQVVFLSLRLCCSGSALFLCVYFARWVSFITCSFPLLTGDTATGTGSCLKAGLRTTEGVSAISAFSCRRLFVCNIFCLWCCTKCAWQLHRHGLTANEEFKHS